MNVNEIAKGAYTAYVLDDASREALAQKYPPKYPKFVGHHITVRFGVPANTEAPQPAQIKVIGHADSGDGLEALVVTVNGTTERPDGKTYHITWSLDATKYRPVQSNDLISTKRFTLGKAVQINAVPQVLK